MLAISKRLYKLISERSPRVRENYQIERSLSNIIYPRSLHLGVATTDTLIDAGDRQIPVRHFLARESANGPFARELLLFFHGGGWVTGSVKSYDSVCAHMARQTGRPVLSVEYRLAPEYPFPAAPDDCYFVLQHVAENAALWNIDRDKITLVGDSAGGNLSAVLSQMTRDRGSLCPHAQILIYPAVDDDHSPTSPYPSVHENGEEYVLTNQRIEDYLALYQSSPEDTHNPYFAPIRAADLSRQPDTLILTAEFDPLRDEGERYGQLLQRAGNHVQIHRLKDALHGFLSTSLFPFQVLEAYEHINAFLDREPLSSTQE